MTCKHDYFDIKSSAICREPMMYFALQVSVSCRECGQAFRFKGLSDCTYNDLDTPSTLGGGLTLHAPIEPVPQAEGIKHG